MMETLSNLMVGFGDAFSPMNLIYVFIGALLGTAVVFCLAWVPPWPWRCFFLLPLRWTQPPRLLCSPASTWWTLRTPPWRFWSTPWWFDRYCNGL